MAIWYIKKMDNNVNIFKRIFKPINIIQVQNKMIVDLPVENDREVNEKLQQKLGTKLAKKLYEKQNQNLILAKNLELEIFKNTLHSNNCNILNGRWLFKYLVPEITRYISRKMNIETEKLEIAIMTDDNSENNLKMIIELAQKIKMLTIVTYDIDKYKRLEEYLLENLGIVIRTTNNRKKALLKSNIIYNIDFPEEVFNQYSIPKKSVIVSINEKIAIKSRRFEGINCNYYSIELQEEYRKWFKENNLLGKFDDTILLESMLYYKKSYEDIREE